MGVVQQTTRDSQTTPFVPQVPPIVHGGPPAWTTRMDEMDEMDGMDYGQYVQPCFILEL